MSITLNPGDAAPAFSAPDQDGKLHSLADYKGKKIALYFYPEDDTPLCTQEACNLRDHYPTLLAQGYVVLGVSADTAAKHKAFAQKYSLPFPLLADPDHAILNAYGVWGEKNMYGKKVMGIRRWTFIIDEQGVITKVFRKVTSAKHAEQILALGS
jgi:peroxiredoxin Q/BCP